MKNILNWTFGSFFRTIGRIACYLIIGGVIAYFMSDGFSNGNFRLADLFGIQRVNASEFKYYNFTYYETSTNPFPALPSYSADPFQTQGFSLTGSVTRVNQNIYFNRSAGTYANIESGGGKLHFQMLFDLDNYIYYSENSGSYLVDNWQNQYIQIILRTNAGWTYCSFDETIDINNLNKLYGITCPIAKNVTGIESFGFYIYPPEAYTAQGDTYTIDIAIQNYAVFEKDSTQAIIDSQNQNHQETINTITDTNSTSEAADTYSFFNSYDNDTQSQLSQVVSAPLTLLNNLIVGTDTKLCFTLKGKQSCIPSGRIIWGKTSRTSFNVGSLTFHPIWFGSGDNITNGITSFVALFNLVVGGFLAYKMLLSLYRMVDDMLNPTNNRIEVLKL